MRRFMSTTAIAFASLVAASGVVAFADPAHAVAPTADLPRAIVQIDDLDLASPAGRSTAARRIRAAADRVCDVDGRGFLASSGCRQKAVKDAQQALEARIAAR